MTIELIHTGSELMLGRVLNSHQQWLCRQLAELGYVVARSVVVGDIAEDIEQAVREALARAEGVIVTGGLGPTSDDVTREIIARMLGRALREDAAVLAQIEDFFVRRKRAVPESTRVQALVPEGAKVLPNPHGTAPGLALEITEEGGGRIEKGKASSQTSSTFNSRSSPAKKWLIMLPGPPRELRPMFIESVLPLLGRAFPPEAASVCTLRTTGMGESLVQEQIGVPLQQLMDAGLELGYCARPGEVDVRLRARGASAERLVREGEAIVRERLGAFIFGSGDEELESVIIRLLTERKLTLAVAESCTGGCIAHRLTNVPGASRVFLGGLVTYSNEAKQRWLGVRAETLARHGAVSEAVAREMAQGARWRTQADFALAVTGIAGPAGGTAAKPVGTVFIGLADPEETVVQQNLNPWDRETFKQVTAQQALNLLRLRLAPAV